MRSVRRRENEGRTDDTGVLGVGALEIRSGVGEMLTGTDLQPFGDMPGGVDTQSVTLVTRVTDDTGLTRIVTGKRIIAFVCTSADRHVILM